MIKRLLQRIWENGILTHSDMLISLASFTVFLIAWEIVTAAGWINPFFSSSPSRILKAAQWLFDHGLWNDILVSLNEFGLGMVLAIWLGIFTGLMIGWYDSLRAMIEPFINMLNATPRVALFPLLILWLGIGIESKIAAVFLGAFFPIVISVMKGVRTVDETLINCARSFGAKDRQIFTTITLPACIPFIVSGLQIAIGRGLVGVVIGEMLASQAGVGHMMSQASATFQTDKVFVGLVLLTGFGFLLTEAVKQVEKQLETWRL
jgi:ABC-type nitrate/sulfonate/bicarbonate transport system permease component